MRALPIDEGSRGHFVRLVEHQDFIVVQFYVGLLKSVKVVSPGGAAPLGALYVAIAVFTWL